MQMKEFDLAVIGGGIGGYVAAIKASQEGKATVLIERKETVGGTCLNYGCIPTKAILKSILSLNEAKTLGVFGIVGVDPEKIELDLDKVQERKELIIKQLTIGGVSGLLKKNGVTVMTGTASFMDPYTLNIEGELLKAENFVIATGSEVFIPPIPVEGDSQILTSSDVLDMREVPSHTVVIGGGAIGIELSYILHHLGSNVDVMEMMPNILPRIDEEVSDQAALTLRSLGIGIHTGAKVEKIVDNTVHYESNGEEHSIESNAVLMAVGRVPSTEGLNIDAAGIKMDGKAIWVDEHMRTSQPHIYATGDVNGKVMLAHTASSESLVAVENILGCETIMDYRFIPQCIYLDPEIAAVGMTEKEAREAYGDRVEVGRFPLIANGKALIEGKSEGFAKVVVDRGSGEIFGFHMLGIHSTDMITEVAIAMSMEATADLVAAAIHPHPTISEVIPETFHSAIGRAIHFYNPKPD